MAMIRIRQEIFPSLCSLMVGRKSGLEALLEEYGWLVFSFISLSPFCIKRHRTIFWVAVRCYQKRYNPPSKEHEELSARGRQGIASSFLHELLKAKLFHDSLGYQATRDHRGRYAGAGMRAGPHEVQVAVAPMPVRGPEIGHLRQLMR